MEFSYSLKIPKERVAVLIGQKGSVKKELEEECHAQIEVDSREGEVVVSGEDSVQLYALKEVVHAIARGFHPDVAKLLLRQDFAFELISIADYAKEKNQVVRVRGRVIGAGGKARRTIEELTETHVMVYGKTVGIIGRVEDVPIAKRAVESLLEGSTHAAVYRWLEKHRRIARREALKDW
ncbi:RNA-processing protein [Candidatus Woesearchaeota archaeon]|nr:MAG: RNA-processing protein [Candidatus Woesearchaeota archaeon]